MENIIVPKVGADVFYKPTKEEKEKMKDSGTANAQDILPGKIVAVWGDQPGSAVNAKVFLDGQGDIWKTSISHGDGEGQFTYVN